MLQAVPRPLLLVAVLALLVGAWPLLWCVRRLVRRLLGRPQPPVGWARYTITLLGGALVLCVGALALTLAFALQTWHAFTAKTLVAEVRCVETAPQKLRLTLVPVAADGARGTPEVYDLEGDQWMVSGDVLRFRPQLTLLGVSTVYSLTRVDGHWNKASDANRRGHSAYDRAGGQRASWLSLYRDGERGPLGWLLAGAHGQGVSQLPSADTTYDLFITPNGLIVDKHPR